MGVGILRLPRQGASGLEREDDLVGEDLVAALAVVALVDEPARVVPARGEALEDVEGEPALGRDRDPRPLARGLEPRLDLAGRELGLPVADLDRTRGRTVVDERLARPGEERALVARE